MTTLGSALSHGGVMVFTRMRGLALSLALAGSVLFSSAVPGFAAGNKVTVTPNDMNGWFFCNDQTNCK